MLRGLAQPEGPRLVLMLLRLAVRDARSRRFPPLRLPSRIVENYFGSGKLPKDKSKTASS